MADTAGIKFRDVFQGVERGSMGYRMLATMGWKEGDGLGAQKQGIKTHIKASKKFDNSGVGAREAAARSQDWTLEMHNFSSVLRGLTEVTSKHAAGCNSSDSDSDAEAGDGGAEGAAKAREGEGGKAASKGKTGKERLAKGRGSQAAAGEDEAPAPSKRKREAAAGEEPAAKQAKAASHSGRYTKREKNKLVRGYSATDLAAILGQKDPVSFPAALPVAKKVVSARVEQTDGKQNSRRKGRKKAVADADVPADARSTGVGQTAAAPPSRLQLESTIIPVDDQPGDATAWWRSSFARAGIVGQAPKPSARAQPHAPSDTAVHVHGFSEQDQANLFNKAHAGKSQGRVGLGQGSGTKKIAGARWEGTKTRLCSDSEGEEEAEGEEGQAEVQEQRGAVQAGDDGCDVLPGGVTVVWANGVRPAWFLARQGQQQQPPEQDAGQAAEAGEHTVAEGALSDAHKRVCNKVVKRALKTESGKVKLQQVVDLLMEALSGSAEAAAPLKRQVKRFVKSSTRWAVKKGHVMAV